MIFQTPQMLFFSLNENLVKSFERYVRYSGKGFREGKYFKLIRDAKHNSKNPAPHFFEHSVDLIFLLEKYEVKDLANLILIFDLNETDNKLKTNIEEIILLYPEVRIIFISFNNDWTNHFINNSVSHVNKPEINIPFIHSYNPFTEGALDLIITGRFNLFDASNLRCYIKQKICDSVKMKENNYKELQNSRSNNFTLVVDEERNQTFFNSYALYRYGFRALPVISFNNLWYTREKVDQIKANRKNLIVRDYDLQFEDYEDIKSKSNCGFDINNILHCLRGIQFDRKKNEWTLKDIFWKNFKDYEFETWFISRLFDADDMENNQNDPSSPVLHLNNKKDDIEIDKKNSIAYLRGINKPVDGFIELCDIPAVRESYKNLKKINGYMILRRTDDDSHSISPKILHIGEALLQRSKKYFENKMYIVSAVMAQEVLEVLNGFHFLVMMNALYQKAISETYIETEFIGIKNIGKGAQKRFKEIKNEAERICRGNKEALRNVLSQIFADIRHIYREKEQFEAADEAHKEFISVNYKFKLGIKKNNETKKN